MENNRPASRPRRRSILTTSTNSGSGLPSGTRKLNDKVSRKSSSGNQKGRQQNDHQLTDYTEPLNANSKTGNNPMTSSVFRSPSMEEQLAKLGIDLNARSSSAGGGWKNSSDNLNVSSGGEAGSGRSTNSFSSGGGGGGQGTQVSARKSARLSNDINKRILGVSNSMDQYGRKVRDIQETMQAAYRNTVQDRIRNKKGQGGSGDDSSTSLDMDDDNFLQKCRESLQKDLLLDFKTAPSPSAFGAGPDGDNNNNNDSTGQLPPPSISDTSSPRKIFGLDASTVLESSSSESSSSESSEEDVQGGKSEDSEDTSSSSSSDEEDGAATMRISIRPPASIGKAVKTAAMKRFEQNIKTKQQQNSQNKDSRPPPPVRPKMGTRRKPRKMEDDFLPPRSLSPIMPSVPDKQFQTMLERREERVSRHLNSMQNEIAQLNHKVEMDKRKAADSGTLAKTRGIMPRSYKGQPMRLMKSQQEKLGTDLNSFIQSTGGQTGGWERKDHNSFKKVFDIWRKHPNKLMEILKKDLPHKKPQEIASHIKWFERFEQLNSVSRATVHQWSQERRRENELIYQMGSASERAKLEGDKRRQEHLRMIREQEKDISKEKLAKWKRSQAVRSTSSATSQVPLQTATSSTSSTAFAQQHPHRILLHHNESNDFEESTEPPRHRPVTSTASFTGGEGQGHVDLSGVRQQILDITAKVHSLDNPKRDFRPPRPVHGTREMRRNRISLGEGAESPEGGNSELRKLATSTNSFTNILTRPPTPPPRPHVHPPPTGFATSSRIKLPEIEPEPSRTRPTSSSTIKPPSSTLLQQQQRRSRQLIAEFRERDSRLVEAKKKAVEIARERRKSNLNQLTAEDIKRRIRSRLTDSTSSSPSFLNPTKQSELRKTLTHLERLEMLSKQDLNAVGHETGDGGSIMSPSVMMINNLPSRGVPSWRRVGGGGESF